MKANFCFYFIIFFCATLLSAQEFNQGFIVTQQYDTIDGLVKKQGDASSEKICIFKKFKNDNEVNYNPEQILSYGYKKGRVYISNQLGIELNRLEPSFIRVIVDGDVPLYYFQGQYAYRAPSKRLYLLLKADNFYQANISAVLVNNCYDLTGKIKSLELSDKSLADFFLSYHRCLNKTAQAYMSKKEVNTLDLSLGSGFGSFSVESANSSMEEFNHHAPSTSGLNLKIRFNKGSRKRISFTTSLSFLYYKGYQIDYSNETRAFETIFDYSSIRASLGAKYLIAYLSDNIKLNFHLGAGAGFSTFKNQERIIDEINGNNIFIRSETFEINNLEPIASASIILDYNIGLNSLFVEFNDSMAFGTLKDALSNTSRYKLNNVAIYLGMKLPLGR
ncbi:hypothetical protein [Ekhidna sp.]|uniref:hypothetical protein n=1 Tax=Ekhidna sp. TaxID=2608089 RepID=UPI003BAACB3F